MRSHRFILVLSCGVVALTGCRSSTQAPTEPPVSPDALRPVASFSNIENKEARSVALFLEAGRVIAHPRCTNCHPADGRPRQGMQQHAHVPAVVGGADGHGPPGLPCTSCHQATNTPTVGTTVASIPGNPKWALAPVEMAWVGRSLGAICEQLKDPKRNGGKDLAALQHHMAKDELVGWGWNPGPGRQPVPGTQAAFGELFQAWVDSGAYCPAP
ncbi:Isoquinoline 1-oxidoreductase subunit [Corallococcus terminator]|uniref:Isoquinoline 1-oxidoreductase subunit n=1 Tax=Corallococcus terminator TaxID=2316733 RepID=A0A3A8JII4_9BACT|nr:Isoquinoline 1-oxidoreductase subunit [Corallococcus terminator]RKG91660.1 Isoquinoline 1-oxidoreductase subunit [Corallococcus terminator]